MTHFLVTLNTSSKALRVRLNVTAGAIRAVYLKYSAAARFPEDIDGQQCDAAEPRCHMTWYERYDRYTGEKRFAMSNETVVPAGGGGFSDKRAAGDWFISVQDAGIAPRTEFTMTIDDVAPPGGDAEDFCDRFGRYDCNHDMWKVPPDLFSAAPSRGPRALATTAIAAAGASTALLALALAGGARGGRGRARGRG